MIGIRILGCLLTLLALVSCGGGDDGADAVANKLTELATSRAPDAKRQALAAPIGVDAASGASKLFDFAESSFASVFPGHKTNRVLPDVIYRYYPETGVYIAVIDWRVFVLGGPFGVELQDMGEVTKYVTFPSTNALPVVLLTSPTGTIGTSTTTISANAGDVDGSVTKVEFYLGGFKIGEDATAPYSISWNFSAGSYLLYATATDNSGAVTKSPEVRVTVVAAQNAPPTVQLTSPTSGARFASGSGIVASAAASDVDGTIARVEFFSGSTKIGEALSAPFQFTWTGVTAGSYQLSAKATDNLGATATSSSVTVTVFDPAPNQVPTVSVTSPSSGASLTQGASTLIEAVADDKDGSISKVEFYYFNTLIGADTTRPYSIAWTPSTAGSYNLYALAYDNSGAGTVSAPVAVTVAPPGPPPSPPGTITAASLSKCPTASGSTDQNSFACFVGTSVTGYQTFAPTKACTLTVTSDGTIAVLTEGASYATSATPIKTYRFYYRSVYTLSLQVGIVGSSQPVEISIDSNHKPGDDFFSKGGWLEVEAKRYSPGAIVNCTIPIPPV